MTTIDATEDNLNAVMEFDCPIEVHEGGTVTRRLDVYGPSLLDGELSSHDWEFFSAGYTGQDRYNGPIMHNSEYIGGRLARDILATPGIYVAVVSEYSPTCDVCEREIHTIERDGEFVLAHVEFVPPFPWGQDPVTGAGLPEPDHDAEGCDETYGEGWAVVRKVQR